MAGVEVTAEYFGGAMGRGWDAAGAQVHRERNARWRHVASDIAARGGLDIIFMVALDDVLEQETLYHFKSLNAKLVLYVTDMLAQWYRVLRSVRAMDLVCYGSKHHLDFYERMGIRLLKFGFAAIPPDSQEMSVPLVRYEGVLFTGSPWPYRQMVLRKIADAKIPLRIYGHNWDRKEPWDTTPGKWRKTLHDIRWYLLPRLREEGPHILGELLRRYIVPHTAPPVRTEKLPPEVVQGEYKSGEFVPLTRGAAINLGFTQMASDALKEYPRMIRLREFEIPMIGGFYLTQNCSELADYYVVDREIAVWDTAKDVVEKCRYYLAHPNERAEIAEAGRRRALENHTWTARFSLLAAELGMMLPGQDGQ